jgi:hypothetical protein
MDWEAPTPSALYNGGYTSGGPVYSEQQVEETAEGYERGQEWDNFAIGKQRFFGRREGEDETGLEGLLAGWGLAEQIGGQAATKRRGGWAGGALSWFSGRTKEE